MLIQNIQYGSRIAYSHFLKITIENRIKAQYNIEWNTGKWRKAE